MILNVGDRVRIKSLDWFKKNCSPWENGYVFLSFTRDINVFITQDMIELCDKEVIIDRVLYPYYYIHDKLWSEELFDVIFSSAPKIYTLQDYINSIKSYCSDFCVLGDRSKCNNFECPFYKYE